jgi:hypothetical protein
MLNECLDRDDTASSTAATSRKSGAAGAVATTPDGGNTATRCSSPRLRSRSGSRSASSRDALARRSPMAGAKHTTAGSSVTAAPTSCSGSSRREPRSSVSGSTSIDMGRCLSVPRNSGRAGYGWGPTTDSAMEDSLLGVVAVRSRLTAGPTNHSSALFLTASNSTTFAIRRHASTPTTWSPSRTPRTFGEATPRRLHVGAIERPAFGSDLRLAAA